MQNYYIGQITTNINFVGDIWFLNLILIHVIWSPHKLKQNFSIYLIA